MDEASETTGTTETTGACHCGAVKFHVKLSRGLDTARRCDCSFCRMRGAVTVTAKVGDLDVTAGEDKLTLYQFGTKTAKHWFCSVCGIYTFHRRRSDPDQYGVNVACLEGVSPFDFKAIPVNNGVVHPSDDPDAPQIAGTLRYEPAS